MRKSLLIAGAALFVASVPVLAASQDGGEGHHMAMKDITRADAEAKVKARFAAADTNKDGVVTQEEVKALREARMAEHRDARFKHMDTNGDGSISRAEFDASAQSRHSRMADSSKDGPRAGGHGGYGRHHRGMEMGMGGRMFEKADANKDGKVTLAEATSAAMTHFDAVDTDKNGTISAQERISFWKTKKDEWKARKSTATS